VKGKVGNKKKGRIAIVGVLLGGPKKTHYIGQKKRLAVSWGTAQKGKLEVLMLVDVLSIPGRAWGIWTRRRDLWRSIGSEEEKTIGRCTGGISLFV